MAGLGTILVGDDGPSARYVAMKHADCAEVGILGPRAPPGRCDPGRARVGRGPVQRRPGGPRLPGPAPAPAPDIDEERVLLAVDPDKDVDGLHPVNLGRLVMGADGPLPCTPAGIVELLAANDVPVEGKHVVIIGRGLTIGRPLALLLAIKRPGCNAAVTVVHTGVDDLAGLVRQGDVVVAAAGRAGLVTPHMVKPGAAVVGAGTSWEGTKLLSDVDEAVAEVAGWMTPRIGGVGPMTRAMLLRNAAAGRRASADRRPGRGMSTDVPMSLARRSWRMPSPSGSATTAARSTVPDTVDHHDHRRPSHDDHHHDHATDHDHAASPPDDDDHAHRPRRPPPSQRWPTTTSSRTPWGLIALIVVLVMAIILVAVLLGRPEEPKSQATWRRAVVPALSDAQLARDALLSGQRRVRRRRAAR